jgi:hypothetical protein
MTGSAGTYSVNISQSIPTSEPMTASASPGGISYDIVSQNVDYLHLSGIVFKHNGNPNRYNVWLNSDVSASFTGSISTTTLTVTAVSSGTLIPGQALSGAGVSAGTVIQSQVSGTTGGVGTYSLNISQSIPSEAMTSNDGPNQNILINDGIFGSAAISAIWITASTGPDITISNTNQFSGSYSSNLAVKDDSGQAVISYFNSGSNNADVVESQVAGSSLGPVRSVYRNNPDGGANGDFIGDHIFEANDATGARQTFGRVLGQIDDATAVSGTLQFGISVSGSMTTFLKLRSSAVTVGNSSTPVEPASDNAQSLGTISVRWSGVYATNCYVGNSGTFWTSGSGNPNGHVSAPVGSLYTDTSGTSGHTLWVKDTGTGNTGWTGK